MVKIDCENILSKLLHSKDLKRSVVRFQTLFIGMFSCCEYPLSKCKYRLFLVEAGSCVSSVTGRSFSHRMTFQYSIITARTTTHCDMIWSFSGFLKTEVLRATQFVFYVIVVEVDFRYFCSLVPCFNQQRRRLVADFASVASFTTSLFGNIKSSRPRFSREQHNKCRLCRPIALSP